MLAYRFEQIEGPGVRHEEKRRVFDAPFGMEVDGVPGIARHVGDVVVELAVLGLVDVGLRPAPEGRALVDHLLLAAIVFQPDREADVVGVGLDDGADAERFQELAVVFAQVKLDPCSAGGVGLRRDRERSGSVGPPAPALGLVGLARHHLDPLRNHEARIEAHTELADETGGEAILPVLLVLSVAALRLGHLLDERLGAGACDRPEVVDQLFAVHADAVVGHHQHAALAIGRNRHRERSVVAQQIGLCDRRVAQLVAGVRGIGDQLPQENLLVAIKRIGHEAEQLADFGLERVALPVRFRHHFLRFARFAGDSERYM